MSKLESLEDPGLPNLPIDKFTDLGIKRYNHVVERELVFCGFIDPDFLKKAKFSFVEKLEI